MTHTSSPARAGFSAATAHRRLAGVFWLALALPAFLVFVPLGRYTSPFDEGPFREAILRGWDSWAMTSWLAFKAREFAMLRPVLLLAFLVFLLLHLFVTAGALRVLTTGVRRPVLRRVVAEGAAQFRPTLWATLRFAITLLFWEGLFVGVPVRLFAKIAGQDAVPNGPWSMVSEVWGIVVGLVVFFNVMARFDLARIALAKDDAPTARGAYRVAKERLRGGRAGAVGLLVFWLVVSGIVQALFTNLGIGMNPATGGGIAFLVLFRQLGFYVLAMTRVGFWASLMTWEEARRPVPLPVPVWQPPVAPPATLAGPATPEPVPAPSEEPPPPLDLPTEEPA